MSIHFLKTHADSLRSFAQETAERADADPENFLLKMAARNQQQAAEGAQRDLALAYRAEVGELLDLRFLGPKADGSIPLDSFIRIADPLISAWKAAAHRIRHGIVPRKVAKDISDILNLKLAGLGNGSTRIFLTGNASPDLAGDSLLQATLAQTFRLLNTTNSEFYDAVDAVGSKAAHHFGEAMKAIDKAGFAAEFTWQANGRVSVWNGTSDEIIRIKTLLDTIAEPESYDEVITGVISALTDTGRLELRTESGRMGVRFPLDLTETVQRLVIAKEATLKVRTTKYWDAITKKDVFKRTMVDVADPNLELL